MKHKLAIFSDGTDFHVFYSDLGCKYTSLTRVTQWVDVDFPARADDADKIADEAAQIDREMEKVVEDNVQKLKALKARKTAILSQVFKPVFEVVE